MDIKTRDDDDNRDKIPDPYALSKDPPISQEITNKPSFISIGKNFFKGTRFKFQPKVGSNQVKADDISMKQSTSSKIISAELPKEDLRFVSSSNQNTKKESILDQSKLKKSPTENLIQQNLLNKIPKNNEVIEKDRKGSDFKNEVIEKDRKGSNIKNEVIEKDRKGSDIKNESLIISQNLTLNLEKQKSVISIRKPNSLNQNIRIIKKRISYSQELVEELIKNTQIQLIYPDLKISSEHSWGGHFYIVVEGNSQHVDHACAIFEKNHKQDEGIWCYLEQNGRLVQFNKSNSSKIEESFRNAEDRVCFIDENNHSITVQFSGNRKQHLRILENASNKYVKRILESEASKFLQQSTSENKHLSFNRMNLHIHSSPFIINAPNFPENFNTHNNSELSQCVFLNSSEHLIKPPQSDYQDIINGNIYSKIQTRQPNKIFQPPNPPENIRDKLEISQLNACIYFSPRY